MLGDLTWCAIIKPNILGNNYLTPRNWSILSVKDVLCEFCVRGKLGDADTKVLYVETSKENAWN